jgi:CubicO group peptidase (beta-lactamase class C family)
MATPQASVSRMSNRVLMRRPTYRAADGSLSHGEGTSRWGCRLGGSARQRIGVSAEERRCARPRATSVATVTRLATDLGGYRQRLELTLREHAHAHGVPGAVVGVLLDDQIETAAYGIANTRTAVEVTPDTLFQIGSITKIYTATLLAQMAGAGVLPLDEPVRAQLQKFAVADPGATLEITPRHLLTHSSGIHGDHLIDTGWNPDALERYLATLPGVGQIHAPDEAYSFCNTGFAVAGRLIETATGENFDRALRHRLLRPIGVDATLTLPQHALLYRVAVGHTAHRDPADGLPTPVRWPFTRSNGPMGGILAPARDVLAFARVHVAGGVAANRTEVLPAATVDDMMQPQMESAIPGEQQALAWTVERSGGAICLGQDADTFGQRAYLRVVPERRFACCLMANSPSGALLAQDMLPMIIGDVLDIPMPEPLARPPVALPDPNPFVGTYERLHQRIDVEATPQGGLSMAVHPSGMLVQLGRQAFTSGLEPLDLGESGKPGANDMPRGLFRATMPDTGLGEPVVFSQLGDGSTGLYLHGRLHRRDLHL